MENLNQITFFGETDARNKKIRFGIKAKDRSRHVYVIGKTGMGKSTLLENLAIQDIQNGNGLAFVDPHGKTADLLLEYVPESRIKDVLYFAPFDLEYPVSFNVMEDVGYDKRHLVAAGLMSSFKKIWVDAWSARMEYILNNILLALLEYPDATLIGVNRMLADKDYRKKVVDNITDPAVKAFWNDEFAKYGERYMQEAGAAIQNKIGQFISNPLIRNIIGQPKSTFDIRELMDQKKILIINLSKGRMGEANANLLGGMLITKIYLGAMSRADVTDANLKELPSFYLFVDEFQNFANESFADILSEARKYKLALTVAHQYIEQMTDEVRAAVFGNVGTMIAFRVGSYDAEVLEKEFAPEFTKDDVVNLGRFQMYLRLMIDEVGSKPFSAVGMMPIAKPAQTYVKEIIDSSRATYAQERAKVEDDIRTWHNTSQAAAKEKPPQASSQKPGQQTQQTKTTTTTQTKTTSYVSSEKKEGEQRSEKRNEYVQEKKAPSHFSPKASHTPTTSQVERVVPTQSLPPQTTHTTQTPPAQAQEVKVVQEISEPKKTEPVVVKVHNPFKTAFKNPNENLDREIALRKSVTDGLVRQSNEAKEEKAAKDFQKQAQQKKGVTQESMQELRSALKDILKESGMVIEKKEKIEEKPPEKKDTETQTKTSSATVQTTLIPEKKPEPITYSERHISEKVTRETVVQEPKQTKPKEIPEAELRKLLEIE